MIITKRKKYGKAVILSLALISVLSFAAGAFAEGTVITVSEGAAGSGRIYVAGNPDNYPVEYYNSKTESFEGIVPQILARVAADTGLDFAYLNGGRGDVRERMVRNKQCELVSCVGLSEEELAGQLAGSSEILFTVGGESYCFGYTSIADEEDVELINAALSGITQEDILNYSVETSGRISIYTGLVPVIMTCVVLIAVLVLVLLIIKAVKRGKLESVSKSEPKLLSAEVFNARFDKAVTAETHAAYSIVCLGIDADNISKNYGTMFGERQMKYCEAVLEDMLDPADLAYRDNNLYMIAGTHGGQDSVNEWVGNILREINAGENSADRMSFHAGICMLTDKSFDKEQSFKDAKQAFYEALSDNKLILFCTPALMKKIHEKNQLAQEAVMGLKDNQFKLYLQPSIRINDKSIVGAEALTRWEHPTMGLLHPAKYIGSMTQTGLIRELDMYTFEACCRVLEDWQTRGIFKYISCNFTRNTIDNEDFVKVLLSKADKYKFDRFQLVMEITEESIEANQSQALENIKLCKEAGFSIALDDVGAGSTSFSDLCEYPIDMMKIDRSILLNAEFERGKTLLAGMVSLARSMNMASLCEGVETEAQLNFLQSVNCDFIQGFHFYHPMPVEVVDSLISGEQKRTHAEA